MSLTPNTTQLPNALIYSSDTDAILPLREYLSQFGCQVFVNIRLTNEPEYFFVVGTREFVTEILEKSRHLSCKTLGIVWSYEPISIQAIWKKNCKLAVVAPDAWNQKTISELLHFLVISKEQFFGIGLGSKHPVIIEKKEEPEIVRVRVSPSPVQKTEDVKPVHSIQTTHHPSIFPNTDTTHRMYKEPSQDIRRISQTIASVYAPSPKQPRRIQVGFLSKIAVFLITLLVVGICCLLPYAFLSYHANILTGCINSSDVYCIDHESLVLSRAVPMVASYDGFLSESVSLLFPNAKLPTTPFVSAMVSVTDILSKLPDYRQNGQTFIRGVISGDTQVPVLSLSQKLLRQTQDIIGLTSDINIKLSEMKTLSGFPLGNIISLPIASIRENVSVTIGMLTQTQQLLSLYPVVGGFRDPSSYGVIVQNTDELRPTGGLLQTLLVFTMDGGVIRTKKVEDVTALDATLRGHVAPPGPIQHILGQEHWYLADSNWDPDFPSAAQKILWFYEKETGGTLDGIIALTTQTIRDYLKYMGPLPLAGTQTVLTAQNLSEEILQQPKTTVLGEPPSGAHSILGSVVETILSSISASDTKAGEVFAKTIVRSLLTGETALYFQDDTPQQMVELYEWEREVPKLQDCLGVSQKQFTCAGLPIQINEANLSSSGIIPIITRSQSRELIVDEKGMVTQYATRTISNMQAGGEESSYTAYLQFVYGQNTVVGSVTVNGQTVVQGQPQSPSSFPYWEINTLQHGLIVGVAVRIVPGASASITVTTKTETPISFGPQGAFLEITTQRQAGIPTVPTSTIIRYPHGWNMSTLRSLLSNSLAIQGQLEYNSDLSQDETQYLILKKNP